MNRLTFDRMLTKDEAIELAFAWSGQLADSIEDGNNLLSAIREVLRPFAEPPAEAVDYIQEKGG